MITLKNAAPEYNSTILYGFHPTPFGTCLIGVTLEGISHLSFVDNEESSIVLLRKEWPKAQLKQEQSSTAKVIEEVFKTNMTSKNLFVRGTDFQTKVWQSLTTIPEGEVTTYENVARMLGRPTAVRAVASAIASNRIAYLVPCHRVISKSGAIHRYRWGAERKKAILDYEAAAAEL